MTLHCHHCNQTLPASEFHAGRTTTCRKCVYIKRKEAKVHKERVEKMKLERETSASHGIDELPVGVRNG